MTKTKLFTKMKIQEQDGIEFVELNKRLYKVLRGKKHLLFLPITSVFDEVARIKHEQYLEQKAKNN